MSQKLPIGEVMNEAVQFGLHRWATVLRFAWAPGLFAILLFGLYFVALFEPSFFTSMSEETTFEEIKDSVRLSAPLAIAGAAAIYLFIILLFCGVAASIFRLVALGEERSGIVQLRVDGPAIRVFLSYLIIMIVSGAVWVAAITGAMVMNGESWSSFVGSFQTSDALSAFKIIGLAVLFAIIPLIYVNVKLTPFPPGSAAENRLLLFGSLSMTFGHAWSIFGILVLYVLFLLVLGLVYGLADGVLSALAELILNLGSVFALIAVIINIVLFAVAIFFQLFTMAIQYAVPAIIYRRLKTGE